jgi:NADH-quinone oxidoreductase subunit H
MDELTVSIINIAIMAAVMWLIPLQILPVLIWLERKGSAIIQDRIGPNRASIFGVRLFGIIHSLADVIKLFMKEDITPSTVRRFYYYLAPFWVMTVSLIPLMLVPIAEPILINGYNIRFQVADFNAGILLLLAVTGLGVYGIILAGWSSNNKFALMGGVRSTAQMISYELSMGLAVVAIVMVYQDLRLDHIIRGQEGALVFLEDIIMLPRWGVITQPLGFFIFTTAAFAETNRNPFDLPEGESELVAGYHIEYSSMKFALFFMAEYVNMVVASFVIATLYLGGYQVPFLNTAGLKAHPQGVIIAILGFFIFIGLILAVALGRRAKLYDSLFTGMRRAEPWIIAIMGMGLAVFSAMAIPFVFAMPFLEEQMISILVVAFQILVITIKVLILLWLFIHVRWTLPRFRYDQLMNLGWKMMLPLAILNLLVTGGIKLL